ncbi:MAG: SBBP repeat-containing protein [Chitinophagales bacterium]|nr:SBBP repeat-containing protein [Chitinophagales bacterium]
MLLCNISSNAQPDIYQFYGSFYGGKDDDFGFTTAVDKDGNICLAGQTKSAENIATPGCFQDTLSTNPSFLTYFDNTGARKWGTYIPGFIFDILIDSKGDIYFTGSTGDSSFATKGSHQDTLGISADAYIAKFSNTGKRIWVTYYGGNGYDLGIKMTFTPEEDLLLVGYTYSTNNIATPGTHQPVNADSGDIFIAKFDTSGKRQWGTYYGGSNFEGLDVPSSFYMPCAITCDNSGNIFLAGSTQSNTNIATPGAYQTNLYKNTKVNGPMYLTESLDGFLVKFDKNGVRRWGTYFGDTAVDYITGVACDNDGNAYISGYTESQNGIATPGSYRTTINDISAFIAKFNTSGNIEWSTYYGDTLHHYIYNPAKIAFDGNRNLYLTTYAGRNMSTPGSPFPTQAITTSQPALSIFNTRGSKIWGTYFGGNSISLAYELDVYKNKSVVSGVTISTDSIATANAHQDTFAGHGGGTMIIFPVGDAYVMGFENHDTNVYITNKFIDRMLCAGIQSITLPYDVTTDFRTGNTFTVQLSDTAGLFTSPVNIGSVNSNTAGTISCTLPSGIAASSKYKIRILGTLPADTSEAISINIHDFKLPKVKTHILPKDTLCSKDTAVFFATLTHPGIDNYYKWYVNGDSVSGVKGSTYTTDSLNNNDVVTCVVTSNTYCLSSLPVTKDSIHVTVYPTDTPNITITAIPSSSVPAFNPILFTTTVTQAPPGASYVWLRNGVVIPGRTSDTLQVFHSSGFKSGDTITCMLVSNNPCGPDTTLSNEETILYYGNVNNINTSNLSIYPNPNKGEFIIKGDIPTDIDQLTIEAYNNTGQVIYRNIATTADGYLNAGIHLPNNIPTGVYRLRITGSGYSSYVPLTIYK